MNIEENKITVRKKQNEELNRIFVKYCDDNIVLMLEKEIISEYILAENILELHVYYWCVPCPPPLPVQGRPILYHLTFAV